MWTRAILVVSLTLLALAALVGVATDVHMTHEQGTVAAALSLIAPHTNGLA